MTSAALQWLALVAMLIDHLGYLFFPGIPLLRAVGRLSFPIFAFLLAEGLAYTANVKRYALRLWAFAVFSEVPYQLFTYGRLAVLPWHNVMFELLLMLAAAWLAQRGGWGFLGAAGIAVGALCMVPMAWRWRCALPLRGRSPGCGPPALLPARQPIAFPVAACSRSGPFWRRPRCCCTMASGAGVAPVISFMGSILPICCSWPLQSCGWQRKAAAVCRRKLHGRPENPHTCRKAPKGFRLDQAGGMDMPLGAPSPGVLA